MILSQKHYTEIGAYNASAHGRSYMIKHHLWDLFCYLWTKFEAMEESKHSHQNVVDLTTNNGKCQQPSITIKNQKSLVTRLNLIGPST